MNQLLQDIEESLSAIVERQENVATACTHLDSVSRAHQAELPERLAHFLEKRSYQKALSFIRDGDTGHHL